MNKRYVVSYIDANGMRRMLGPCQGRETHETYQQAQVALGHLLINNSPELLTEVYGKQALDSFAVSAIECWPDHHDPKGIYIQEDLNPDQDIPRPWEGYEKAQA